MFDDVTVMDVGLRGADARGEIELGADCCEVSGIRFHGVLVRLKRTINDPPEALASECGSAGAAVVDGDQGLVIVVNWAVRGLLTYLVVRLR